MRGTTRKGKAGQTQALTPVLAVLGSGRYTVRSREQSRGLFRAKIAGSSVERVMAFTKKGIVEGIVVTEAKIPTSSPSRHFLGLPLVLHTNKSVAPMYRTFSLLARQVLSDTHLRTQVTCTKPRRFRHPAILALRHYVNVYNR